MLSGKVGPAPIERANTGICSRVAVRPRRQRVRVMQNGRRAHGLPDIEIEGDVADATALRDLQQAALGPGRIHDLETIRVGVAGGPYVAIGGRQCPGRNGVGATVERHGRGYRRRAPREHRRVAVMDQLDRGSGAILQPDDPHRTDAPPQDDARVDLQRVGRLLARAVRQTAATCWSG